MPVRAPGSLWPTRCAVCWPPARWPPACERCARPGAAASDFFTDLSVAESAAAASAVAQVSTTAVFGYPGPDGPAEEDLRSFSRLRGAVDASLVGVPAARLRAAAFLLAASRKRESPQSPKGER